MTLTRYIDQIDALLGAPEFATLPSKVADLIGDYYDLLSDLDSALAVPDERKPSGSQIEGLIWESLGLDGAP